LALLHALSAVDRLILITKGPRVGHHQAVIFSSSLNEKMKGKSTKKDLTAADAYIP